MKILDKLDKLAPREKLWLAVAFICVFCALMDRLVVNSLVSKLKKMDSAIEQAKHERDRYLRTLAREKEVRAEYDRIGGSIVKAASPSEAVAGMKVEMHEAAKRAGVVINAADQREVRPKSFCDEYVVEITKFDADMKNLISFIYGLDASPGMTKVVRLNIAPGKTKDSVTGSMLLTKVMVVEGSSRPKPAGGPPAGGAPKR